MNSTVFKIVKIPSEYEVIINGGQNYDLNIGDVFEIYLPGGEIITDPDTKQELGALDVVKDTVEITSVLEKMSICKKITRTSPSSFAGLADTQNSFKQYVESFFGSASINKLNVNYDDLSTYLNDPSRSIRVGDFVRLIRPASTKKDSSSVPISDN